MSPINKWVATLAQDVTHSRQAVLSPLMTINVNRTISAHPLKCLTVDGLVVKSIVHTYPKIDSGTERPPLILAVPESHFFAFLTLLSPLSIDSKGPKKATQMNGHFVE